MQQIQSHSAAAVSSRLYQLFALIFGYPDADWVAAVRAGEVAERLRELFELCGESAIAAPITPDLQALTDAGEDDDALAVEYTRLFDTGPGGTPISLYGGHHQGGRMQTMEEVLRFYQHFGIALNQQLNELPDHLVSELEFMHFMSFSEASLLAGGGDAGHFQRGQQDFLTRQLGRWAPELHPVLLQHQALPFFTETTRLLGCFLQQEQVRLSKAGVSARG